MAKRRFVGVLMICSIFWLSSCYYDKEEDLYPNAFDCDLSNVTYSNDIKIIFTDNCYACHSASTNQSLGFSINLEDTLQIKSQINSGALLGSIKHLGGYNSMPRNSAKLSDCQINTIEKWVLSGASFVD